MKKDTSLLKSGLGYLIFTTSVIFLFFTIYTSVICDAQNISIFGYQGFIVKSNSMAATDFKAGDLIIVKKVDPKELSVGDIITFKSSDPNNFQKVITHKIRKIEDNNQVYTTYGTSTNIDDVKKVLSANLIGRYLFKISKLGFLLNFLKNNLLFFLIFSSLCYLIFTLNIKLIKKYKKAGDR